MTRIGTSGREATEGASADREWADEGSVGVEQGWRASLALEFARRDGTTRLIGNRHRGPLRLLKALPSEDGRSLEAVIVHPPGGLVGGDRLDLRIHAGAGSRVLLTTPGAQKWYRAARGARSEVAIDLESAMLEWLPQPAILFDEARADQHLSIRMNAASTCIGWEILVRGRAAMGERWRHGAVDQTIRIDVDGNPLWHERLAVAAGDRLFDSPVGWHGHTVAASVWCCSPQTPAAGLKRLSDDWHAATAPVTGAATLAADGLVLAKLLGDDLEPLQAACQRLWTLARTLLDGSPGRAPRLWRT